METVPGDDQRVLDPVALGRLIEVIREAGYRLAGPRIVEGVVGYDEIGGSESLPRGVGDEQGSGTYRLTRVDGGTFFEHAVGPHSWKKFLSPPSQLLFGTAKDGAALRIEEPIREPPKWAFFGVRPCDLAAIQRLDVVFLGGPWVDPAYQAARKDCLIVVVQCTSPSGTCFCASMGTGPRAEHGFDLAITELTAGGHRLLVEVGTVRGREILAKVPGGRAGTGELAAASGDLARATERMGRTLERDGLKEALLSSAESPQWEEIARRCLACGSCTMVCPTCFCSTVVDTSDLSGSRAERRRLWDSCFTLDFSYIHGGSVRRATSARYRQWMTHKLATWVDQFGEPGCVGCGRCVTWCPAGIDLTEEARTIRAGSLPPQAPTT